MISSFWHWVIQINFVTFLQFCGCVTFSISGIRLASAKKIDWFGALVLGYITAIGGGTIRDLFLGVVPFWMNTSLYIGGSLLALVTVIYFRKQLVRLKNTIFWFDCIGLSLLVVVGFSKALAAGYPYWICVSMGVISGTFGGVTRDILINEIPIAFSQEFYAMSCILGGIGFSIMNYLHLNNSISSVITALLVILIRYLSVRYKWKVPIIRGDEGERLKLKTKLKTKA